MLNFKKFFILFGIFISGCSIAPWNDISPDFGMCFNHTKSVKTNQFILISRNSTGLEVIKNQQPMIFIPPKKKKIKQDFFWYYLDLNFSPPTPF